MRGRPRAARPVRAPMTPPLTADRIAVVLSTYNWPHALELSLAGYAVQTMPGFQLVIADDGSRADTRTLIERVRVASGMDIVHVWHEDRGFRKTEILNRAIIATTREYIIFSDGDTIPRADLVEVHAREAEPQRFLAGGYIKLPAQTSDAITPELVRSGAPFRLSWLRARGYRPGRHVLRFTRARRWAALLDGATSHKVRWVGNNASTWRTHLLAANGFDMDMGYGGEDAALGERLGNLGVRPKRIRYRTLALHLHHERPWRDPAEMARNAEIRRRIRESGAGRAARGIAELPTA